MTRKTRIAHNHPLAAPGYLSYRYPSAFGWVMIGAKDDGEALREAARSISTLPNKALLERWDGPSGRYVRVGA